jgi:hypothetical protein
VSAGMTLARFKDTTSASSHIRKSPQQFLTFHPGAARYP